ncbi:hypothetical protein FHR84_004187 [Actinopolyspora biskrensis]|uniref:Uncharacterized protein n=1 Tax=Actinopolyspora biskrensis TaxID=1470178 RepID=A0A852Z508_9ACTN|nr:hypothetical protein [Actinopolyspora biskrensis]NYH80819.1 hypothetical protein [Actinopolyspora biskrensis]
MHPLALLDEPAGLLPVLGTVLALALGSVLAPLRGGHGQHAGAGPGALTVHTLTAEPTGTTPPHRTGPPARAPVRAPDPVHWPTTDPDQPHRPNPAGTAGQLRHALAHGPSLAEQDLAALLGIDAHPDSYAPEPGYIGRHRLNSASGQFA